MIETLIGTVIGGLFRIAPEILKLLDTRNERHHELTMLAAQVQADSLKAEQNAQHLDTGIGAAEIQAVIEATQLQAQRTGFKFVDAFNALIRPLLALQWLILLWPALIAATFILAIQTGADPMLALQGAFGNEEKAMASSIASFWMVDRALRKMSGR